jgi:hypothetical protein
MKKFVYASVMALASLSLAFAPTLRAQDTIQIKDPAEFNAYQMATTQSDPKARASAEEGFLTTYPQSVVKKAVLDSLIDTYQQLGDADKTLAAASRMLQVEPENLKAIFISVYIKKSQCAKTADVQTCDDAAALAKKGLAVNKPAGVSDEQWKQQTAATFPIFHSAIAVDDITAKKDIKGGIEEYRQELMLYPPEATQIGPGLADTLMLAEAYTKPEGRDLEKAVWFYARAWNFAPANFKGQIEPKLEYYYKKYHGDLKGLDDVKAAAGKSLFPAQEFHITQAKTPAEQIHDLVASTPDLKTLALDDKETVLALGTKEDADKLWGLLQGQQTPVPGTVIEATASQIKVAVTQDAKAAKTADFIVNMKAPLTDKEIPAVGSELKLLKDGGPELDGTYDTYTQIPATATTVQSAQIVLKDGLLQTKKAAPKAPATHKPAAGHRPAGN